METYIVLVDAPYAVYGGEVSTDGGPEQAIRDLLARFAGTPESGVAYVIPAELAREYSYSVTTETETIVKKRGE